MSSDNTSINITNITKNLKITNIKLLNELKKNFKYMKFDEYSTSSSIDIILLRRKMIMRKTGMN